MKRILFFLIILSTGMMALAQDTTGVVKQTFKQSFLYHFLGGVEPGFFVSATTWSILGVVFMILVTVATRNPMNPNSPVDFSFQYLLSDKKNWFRFTRSILIAIIGLFVLLRFTEEILGKELNMFMSFLIGAGLDRLLLWLISVIRKNTPTPNAPGN